MGDFGTLWTKDDIRKEAIRCIKLNSGTFTMKDITSVIHRKGTVFNIMIQRANKKTIYRDIDMESVIPINAKYNSVW